MNFKQNSLAILAILATVGVFIILGYIPHRSISYVLLLIIMYIYAVTVKIDNVLFKVMILLTIVGVILGWWTGLYDGLKDVLGREGFVVTPLTKISDSITSRECQDVCEKSKTCKFSQVPVGTTLSGQKHICWNSSGLDQKASGSRTEGGDTWENKTYKNPITICETRGFPKTEKYLAFARVNSKAKKNDKQ